MTISIWSPPTGQVIVLQINSGFINKYTLETLLTTVLIWQVLDYLVSRALVFIRCSITVTGYQIPTKPRRDPMRHSSAIGVCLCLPLHLMATRAGQASAWPVLRFRYSGPCAVRHPTSGQNDGCLVPFLRNYQHFSTTYECKILDGFIERRSGSAIILPIRG